MLESLVLYVNSYNRRVRHFDSVNAQAAFKSVHIFLTWRSTEPYDLGNNSGSHWDGQYFTRSIFKTHTSAASLLGIAEQSCQPLGEPFLDFYI